MASCSLVTPSYIRDLALVRNLCASVDKFVPPEIEHILVVPAGDWASFSDLQSRRRKVITQESVIPWYFRRVPSPRRLHIPGVINRPIRQAWLSPVGLLSGWLIANSIVKIASPSYCDTDLIVLADSDMEIIKPFDASLFDLNGKVPLHARKAAPIHQSWNRSAARMLGIPSQDYFGFDFIGHLVAWKRENVLLMQKHIEAHMHMPWPLVMAWLRDVAETVTYGIYCQEVLGEKSGHIFTEGFTYSFWSNSKYEDNLDQLGREMPVDAVAVLIQSTSVISLDERRRMIDAIIRNRSVAARAVGPEVLAQDPK